MGVHSLLLRDLHDYLFYLLMLDIALSDLRSLTAIVASVVADKRFQPHLGISLLLDSLLRCFVEVGKCFGFFVDQGVAFLRGSFVYLDGVAGEFGFV